MKVRHDITSIHTQYTSISLIIKLVSYLQVTMLPDCNFLSYIVVIYSCSMGTTSGKKAVELGGGKCRCNIYCKFCFAHTSWFG